MNNISCVLIIPAALQSACTALALALGYSVDDGGQICTVPLYLAEAEAPTHYGGHAMVTAGFRTLVENAQQGVYPEGIDAQAAGVVMGSLTASFRDTETIAPAHFDEVANGLGVARRQDAD